ncbi:MAG: hypothetical protein P4L50_10980 [Anaerolineaceae bacterium]|nr:hypothetical protein [Anaerolineaceae bacterium]
MGSMKENCEQILAEARKQNVLLRVIGGMAVHLHCPEASLLPALKRDYGDLDFVTASPDDQRMRAFFESIDFCPNLRFNALQGKTRMIYNCPDGSWYLDLFINEFRMCHKIKFSRERLHKDPVTIPLAELFLTKLQIIKINPKDVKDVAALLLEHPLGDHDDETINVQRINAVITEDWGFYTTVRMNMDKIPEFLLTLELPEKESALVRTRLAQLAKAMDEAPKSMKWKMRAAVGKSVAWYEEPEDATREELKLE